MATQRFVHSFVGHSNWVRSCRFSNDARLIVSGGDDCSVRLWDLRSRHCAVRIDEAAGAAHAVAMHPSNACIASGG